MAGHSKWANIKHRKAAADAKKGKITTRLVNPVFPIEVVNANKNSYFRSDIEQEYEWVTISNWCI